MKRLQLGFQLVEILGIELLTFFLRLLALFVGVIPGELGEEYRACQHTDAVQRIHACHQHGGAGQQGGAIGQKGRALFRPAL